MADVSLIIIGILLALVLILVYLLVRVQNKINQLSSEHESLKHDLRSANIKHGKHWENFVPFMPEFEKVAEKENAVFLGMPVDFVAFDDDAVKFIEVKTGKSRLNEKQEKIKRLINDKKVKWHELRYEKKE